MYKSIIMMVLVVTLFGCVSMNVSRVQVLKGGEEICIENNDRVKSAFLDAYVRSEEHTSELQSPCNIVCRLLLEKKKEKK